MEQVTQWMASPTLLICAESPDYWETFRGLASRSKPAGPLMHDARVAAICTEQAVQELWSSDRDFSRFPDLKVRNPVVPV